MTCCGPGRESVLLVTWCRGVEYLLGRVCVSYDAVSTCRPQILPYYLLESSAIKRLFFLVFFENVSRLMGIWCVCWSAPVRGWLLKCKACWVRAWDVWHDFCSSEAAIFVYLKIDSLRKIRMCMRSSCFASTGMIRGCFLEAAIYMSITIWGAHERSANMATSRACLHCNRVRGHRCVLL